MISAQTQSALALSTLFLCLSTSAQNSILLSDFGALNPVVGNDVWASQIQAFSDGTHSGQEVVPLGGGNPTSAGDAFSAFFTPVNLSGATGLTLLARALPGNVAGNIYVTLFSGGSGRPQGESWAFDVSGLSTSSFQLLTSNTGTPLGDTLDFAHVDDIAIGGQGFGSDPVRLQFAELSAVTSVPEPNAAVLTGAGLVVMAAYNSRRRLFKNSQNLSIANL